MLDSCRSNLDKELKVLAPTGFEKFEGISINSVNQLVRIRSNDIDSYYSLYHKLKTTQGVPTVAQWVKNPSAVAWVIAELQVQYPARHNRLKTQSCHSCPAAQNQPLAQEPAYATGAAIKKKRM